MLRLVLTRGLTLVALGILIGITASLSAGRLIQRTLFGVQASDPLTFASVSLSLVVVALIACIVPALRAMRLDPAAVLKDERPGVAATASPIEVASGGRHERERFYPIRFSTHSNYDIMPYFISYLAG